MKSIAFFVDSIPFIDSTISHTAILGATRKLVDQWCAMANLTPIWIDTTEVLRKTNGNVFWSWAELVEKHGEDHTLIFLDESGTETIENLVHPNDNVIYCIGADFEEGTGGFGTVDLSTQQTVRLTINRSCYGFTVVPIVATARMFWDN